MTQLNVPISPRTTRGNRRLTIALPEPGLAMDQDAEWCVVRFDNRWQQIRFHDYDDIYAIPGLYERLFYDVLRCNSPTTIRTLLEQEIEKAGTSPRRFRVLDLGAGNGMVGEEMAAMCVDSLIGVDIIHAAAKAVERDRPGIYDEYLVTDMAHLSKSQRGWLESIGFNCLTCVAALGFGDIPPAAFATAYNLIESGGWIAFNIKEDFLSSSDVSGFARLIRTMCDGGVLTIRAQRRYQHRLATNGKPIMYLAVVGVKQRAIKPELLFSTDG